MEEFIKKIISHQTNFKPVDCLILVVLYVVLFMLVRNIFNDLDSGLSVAISLICSFMITLFQGLYKSKKSED